EGVLHELRRDSGSGERLAAELEFTLAIADVAGDNVRLMEPLQRLHEAGELRTARDLARFDASRLMEILYRGVDGKPITAFPEEAVSDRNLADALRSYAGTLADAVADALPMDVIRDRIGRDTNREGIAAFLERNPDFAFGAGPVQHYLKEHPAALEGVADPHR